MGILKLLKIPEHTLQNFKNWEENMSIMSKIKMHVLKLAAPANIGGPMQLHSSYDAKAGSEHTIWLAITRAR